MPGLHAVWRAHVPHRAFLTKLVRIEPGRRVGESYRGADEDGADGTGTGSRPLLIGFVSRRERYFWLAAFAAVAVIQWPMMKGLYYRVSGATAPAGRIEWRTD